MTDPQDTATLSSPSEDPQPLDPLIASIRAAVAPDASAEVRAIGATACRSILTALEAKAGQPLAAAPPATTSPLAGLLAELAAMPREQLLATVISRLRAALPSGTSTTPAAGAPRFHLIQIPQVRRPGGGT